MLKSETEKWSRRGLWPRELDQRSPDGKAVGGDRSDRNDRKPGVLLSG